MHNHNSEVQIMAAKFAVNDRVVYRGRVGKVIDVFRETTHPKIVWRYIISLRDGDWSVKESSLIAAK